VERSPSGELIRLRRRAGRDGFVKHDGDLAITRAENNLDVQPNQGAKAPLHMGNAAHGIDHPLLSDIHGVVHDLEQYLVLALKVMVETALAKLLSAAATSFMEVAS
jgi:hypothetical protein